MNFVIALISELTSMLHSLPYGGSSYGLSDMWEDDKGMVHVEWESDFGRHWEVYSRERFEELYAKNQRDREENKEWLKIDEIRDRVELLVSELDYHYFGGLRHVKRCTSLKALIEAANKEYMFKSLAYDLPVFYITQQVLVPMMEQHNEMIKKSRVSHYQNSSDYSLADVLKVALS